MNLAEKITRAKGGDWHGHQGLIPGPGHSPDDRSMSIRDGGDDGVVLHSFAGDDWRQVKDAWRADGTLPPRDAPDVTSRATITPYVYCDAAGQAAFRMVRTVRPGHSKSFHAESPDGHGGWTKGMGGASPLPYRLPELLAAHPDEPVYIVEGEKDADSLAALGLIATTNPNGAGKWRDSFATHLRGRECVILPDNDQPGRDHATKIAASLRASGIDHVVVELPDLPAKGDATDWLACGGDAAQLEALAAAAWSKPCAEAGTATSSRPNHDPAALPLEWFEAIDVTLSGLWLIKRLLPAIGMALIYGHPGSGKSFLAIDLALHIALGWDWNGRKVKQGLVVYVAAEGATGLKNRVVAFKRYHQLTGELVPFALITTPVDLQARDADLPRLIASIRAAIEHTGQQPAAIFIDTLSKTFGAGQENTDDMAVYVGNGERVAKEFRCLYVPVHHRPKDSENVTPRGHGSLVGGVDTILLVEAGRPRRVRVTKQKDGEEGEPIGFDLKSIHLGEDEDGEPVTSCVVELTDGVPMTAPSGKRLTAPQVNALAALARAIEESGVDAPAGIPLAVLKHGLVSKVAAIADWRAAVYATNAEPDKKPDTLLKTFNRAVDGLKALGAVQVWEGFAWPTPR